jgi:hypothetical protein
VLAVIALAGIRESMVASIATIIFGAALLIQGGTMLSEFAQLIFPADSVVSNAGQFGGGTLATLFLAGTAGIVLGILALLGIQPLELSAIAVIAFGAALVLSSNAVWQLHVLRRSAMGAVTSGSEILASEMASGSAGVQALAGLAAIVLGILAVVGTNPIVLTPVALAVMGVTIVMTGSTLSGAVASFMGSTTITTSLKSPTA